jgi:parallel beta-helix repeat protein
MTDANPLLPRRQALGAAALGALATALARPASSRAASASNLYVVVDAAGGGDYADLETAVAAVGAGNTIFVKAGLYQIEKGDMRPAQGVRIIGEGWGTHIQAANGLNSNLFVAENDDIMFESLRIDGNGANQKLASGNCIYFGACVGGGVRGCWVQASPGYNIVCFPGASHIVIAENFVSDGLEEGIELQGASSCSVVGNIISNHTENGIYLWNSSGDCSFNAVVGNTVSGSTEWNGIQVTDGAHDNTIAANRSADVLVG